MLDKYKQSSKIKIYNYQLFNRMDPSAKEYFGKLIKTLNNPNSSDIKNIYYDVLSCKRIISQQIRMGKIQIPSKKFHLKDLKTPKAPIHSKEDIQIISKRLLLQRAIQRLKPQDFPDEESYNEARQQLLSKKQALTLQQKIEKVQIQKNIGQKVKKWSHSNKQMLLKRQRLIEDLQRKQLEEKQIQKKKQLEKKILMQKEKKKAIEQKLREIEENRIKREQFFRSVKSHSMDRTPYYIEAQKKYQSQLQQKKFEQQILRKQKKSSMKMDYEALKKHQKQYNQRLKQRNTLRVSRSRSYADNPFNIYTNRSEQKFMNQRQKRQRRIKFQQRIDEIPIDIDEAKKVQIQIEIDRAKNPFKYNFLSQKSLNYFQIYGQFKNFQMNMNARQQGIQNLQELKKIAKQSRVNSSNQAPIINQQSPTERPQYRNYLKEMQIKKKKNSKEQDEEAIDEISKAIKKYKSKEKTQKQLTRKYCEYETLAGYKKQEIKRANTYKDIARKQAQMDDALSQAMKARLAMLQLKK